MITPLKASSVVVVRSQECLYMVLGIADSYSYALYSPCTLKPSVFCFPHTNRCKFIHLGTKNVALTSIIEDFILESTDSEEFRD